jgi:alkaline phosphatase D
MIKVRPSYPFSFNPILDYQSLKEKTTVIGVWDDHDYGTNNGDHTWIGKHLHREIFLDFIGEP